MISLPPMIPSLPTRDRPPTHDPLLFPPVLSLPPSSSSPTCPRFFPCSRSLPCLPSPTRCQGDSLPPPPACAWVTWKLVFLLDDILCCCAVLLPIVWSIKNLREVAWTNGKAIDESSSYAPTTESTNSRASRQISPPTIHRLRRPPPTVHHPIKSRASQQTPPPAVHRPTKSRASQRTPHPPSILLPPSIAPFASSLDAVFIAGRNEWPRRPHQKNSIAVLMVHGLHSP